MWGVVFTACVVFFSAHKVIASILKYSVLWIPTDYMLPCQTLRMQRFYVLGGRNIALGVSIAANPMQRIHWIATLLPFQFLPLIPSFSNATILIYLSFPSLQVKDFLTTLRSHYRPHAPLPFWTSSAPLKTLCSPAISRALPKTKMPTAPAPQVRSLAFYGL